MGHFVMNKRKGFVLAETIFVIGVLTTSLIIIYYAFNTVINNQKKRFNYNDTAYLNRTYYVLRFLNDRGLSAYMDYILADKIIYSSPCSDDDFFPAQEGEAADTNEKKLCETVINKPSFNVNNLYITKYDLTDVLFCISNPSEPNCDSFPILSIQFIAFLKTEQSDREGSYQYRIIIEYKKIINEKTLYYYASLGFN